VLELKPITAGDVLRTLLDIAFGRAIVATILLVGTFALLLTEHEVPVVLWSLNTAAVTFFFVNQAAVDRNGVKR
jgi:uncharacterized membrane protein (UPF0136 family)